MARKLKLALVVSAALCLGIAALAGAPRPRLQSAAGSPTSAPDTHAEVKTLKITILSTMLADDGIGEWGFAALVDADGHKILFDTGAHPNTVLENAKELKIDLSDVQDIVLSHFHDDHTTGLMTLRREFMKKNPTALFRAHVAKGIFLERRRGKTGALVTAIALEALHQIAPARGVTVNCGERGWFGARRGIDRRENARRQHAMRGRCAARNGKRRRSGVW